MLLLVIFGRNSLCGLVVIKCQVLVTFLVVVKPKLRVTYTVTHTNNSTEVRPQSSVDCHLISEGSTPVKKPLWMLYW